MKADLELLNINEAAKVLQMKVSTLYSWVHLRKIRYRKHGSKLLFLLDDLLEWSNSQSVEPYQEELFASYVRKRSTSSEARSLKTRRASNS